MAEVRIFNSAGEDVTETIKSLQPVDTSQAQQAAEWLERSILWKGPDGYVTPNIEHIAAMLRTFDAANKEWHDKTEWLRKDLQPHELGKHLADVLRGRLDVAARVRTHLRNTVASDGYWQHHPQHAPDGVFDTAPLSQFAMSNGWTQVAVTEDLENAK